MNIIFFYKIILSYLLTKTNFNTGRKYGIKKNDYSWIFESGSTF
jgi:hypothetical protein